MRNMAKFLMVVEGEYLLRDFLTNSHGGFVNG